MGDVRCGKIERGKHHPVIPGFQKILAYSNGQKEWKPLSPFLIGPFSVIDNLSFAHRFQDGIHPGFQYYPPENKQIINCLSFERYWQGGKIFAVDYDQQHQLKFSFFERRRLVFTDPQREKKDIRHPLPKAKYGYPVAGFYNGEILGYVESRKKYYCPAYAYFASMTPEYQELKRMHDAGQNLLICGPDGLDVAIDDASLRRLINDPKYIFGHELVLCCMLKGLTPWIDIPHN
jgi:hypothetical protein